MNAKHYVALGCMLMAGFSLALTRPGRALADHVADVFVTGGTVGIDPSHNTVTVGNASLRVQPNDAAGAVSLFAQAVDNGSGAGGEAGLVDGTTSLPFTVPAGQRLVVDSISLFVSTPNAIPFNSVFLRRSHPVGGATLTTTMQMATAPVGDNPSFKFYASMGTFKAYFEAGDRLSLGYTTIGSSNSSQANLWLFGRLVPAI